MINGLSGGWKGIGFEIFKDICCGAMLLDGLGDGVGGEDGMQQQEGWRQPSLVVFV